jgi:hypothetical protein
MACGFALNVSCRSGCFHRQMVDEYRSARYAAQLQRDEITLQYPAEEALANARLGPVSPTFRSWLEGLAGQRQAEEELHR